MRLLALPALMIGLGAWSLAPGTAALPLVALFWVAALALVFGLITGLSIGRTLALFSAGTGDPGSRRHNLNPCLNTHRPPP